MVFTKTILRFFGRADKASQRAGKAKANGSNSSLPAFEEDQEVERQAMLSSPPKKGKRVTSEVCASFRYTRYLAKLVTKFLVKIEKKGDPKLPGQKKVKTEVDSADKAKNNNGQKEVKVKPRPVQRVSSRQPKPIDKSEDVSDQDGLDLENRPGSHGKRSAQGTQKADSDVVELGDTSDELDNKPNSKARRKHPTNDANLPNAVKNDSVTWRVTILGAYRAHMACTEEVWTINNGTALRHLQLIWNFYMPVGSKQSHSFVENDPVLSLVRLVTPFESTALTVMNS